MSIMSESQKRLVLTGPSAQSSDFWRAGGSILQRLQIYRTGFKFPPYQYDPDAPPGSVVGLSWRRNGQPVTSRRTATAVARAVGAT